MSGEAPNLRQSLRALPREAWILYAGTFLNKFGAFVIPFLAIYLRDRGYSDRDAALALAAYGLGHIVASGLGGYLADRIGRRRTIALSMFGSAAAMLLLSQADSRNEIIALTALTAIATELYRPASSALLTDLVTPEQRVTAFAAYRWALNAGWAFGPATAGFLSHYSFTWLFVGDAVTSILFGLVAWFALPHGVHSSGATAAWPEALRVIRKDRRLHKLLLAQLAVSVVFLQMSSTFGLHVMEAGFSKETYGALLSLNGVLIVLFELPLTTFTRRRPAAAMIAAGYLLIGAGFAFSGWAHTLPALGLAVVIFTVGEMIAMPVASAYFADGAPAAMRGRYMGVLGFIWALGLTIGPTCGVALHAARPALLWSACGALGVIAALFVWSSRKENGPTENSS